MNGVPGSRRLHLSEPVENVFQGPRFGDICLPPFLFAREVGMCNPWFYVLLILIKFSTTKRGHRILPTSENMRTSSFFHFF
jgi:hypothetical protein